MIKMLASSFLILALALPSRAQTYGAEIPWAALHFVNASGGALPSGKLCTYVNGTTTPQSTYVTSDISATGTLNANPIIMDSSGRPTTNGIYLIAAKYTMVLKTAGTTTDCTTGTTVWTANDVFDLGQLLAAGLVSFTAINNKQYCTTGANFGAKFTAAAALLPSTGGIIDCSNLQGAQTIASDVFTGQTKPITLVWPTGTASSTVSLTIPSTMTVDFPEGGILSMAAATTATINGEVRATRSQHFTGSGSVVLAAQTNQIVYPSDWWATYPASGGSAATIGITSSGGQTTVAANPFHFDPNCTGVGGCSGPIFRIGTIVIDGASGFPQPTGAATYDGISSGNLIGFYVPTSSPPTLAAVCSNSTAAGTECIRFGQNGIISIGDGDQTVNGADTGGGQGALVMRYGGIIRSGNAANTSALRMIEAGTVNSTTNAILIGANSAATDIQSPSRVSMMVYNSGASVAVDITTGGVAVNAFAVPANGRALFVVSDATFGRDIHNEYAAGNASPAAFNGLKARGSYGSEADVSANDAMVQLGGNGWRNGAFRAGGSVQIVVNSLGASDINSDIVFLNAVGSSSSEFWRMDYVGRLLSAGIAFANLGAPANGAIVYCTDCNIANPCTGGGTGALAKRIAGAWICN